MPDKMDVRSQTIEECAKWHDEKASEWAKRAKDAAERGEDDSFYGCSEIASHHTLSAQQIRSLPPPSVEEGYSPGVKAVEELRELTALRKAGEGAVGLQYRFDKDTRWHSVDFEDQLPYAGNHPNLEVRKTYAHPSPAVVGEGWLWALDELRTAGWMVAVHNDYRINGEAATFWLFTHPDGRWIKGEGATDEVAIAAARAMLSASPSIDKEGA